MKPMWKWIIGFLLVLIVACFALSAYFSRNWKPVVEEKLQELVKKSTDSLYRLTYEDLDFNVALGNVTLKNVTFRSDSIVYAQLEDQGAAPDNVYDITFKELKVKRVGIIDMVKNKVLNIKSITFEQPELVLRSKYHAYNDTIRDKQQPSLYENVRSVFEKVNVDDLQLEDLKVKYMDLDKKRSSDLELANVQIRVHDVLIDETSLSDTSRFLYTKLVEVIVPGFTYKFSDGFYQASFQEMKVNTQEQNVLLTAVSFEPQMGREAYFKKRGENRAMINFSADTLRMETLDFRKLLDFKQVIASRVQLKNGGLKIFGDKRYKKNPKNQIGQAPHQKLMRLKSLLALDSVFVENFDVVYAEMSGKFHKIGEVSFAGTSGYLANVTNDSTRLEKDKIMHVNMNTRIMNHGNMHAKFELDMLSKAGSYRYSGSVGSMSATHFNRVLTPLLNIEIGSGNIRSINYNMYATDHRSNGDFRFDYDDLKIKILDRKEKTTKRVISFLINQILINDSNPDANAVYHVGKVEHRRDPTHTFFKDMWQSLLEGIKQTAGISKEREARLTGSAEEVQSTLEQTKGKVKKTKGFFNRLFKKDKQPSD
ncbi:MAG: hypothetical protein ACTJHT_00135 [Sphingobacterium sp.]